MLLWIWIGFYKVSYRLFKHRQWLTKRNKKNLIKRTRKKNWTKQQLTNQHIYNRRFKERYCGVSEKSRVFQAPLDFSFVNNKDETMEFFNKIIDFISHRENFGKSIFIMLRYVVGLTTDALMYLLAVVTNLNNKYNRKYTIAGDYPMDVNIRTIFVESGFYKYVKTKSLNTIEKTTNRIQIMTGDNSNPDMAKKLSDFVCEKAHIQKKQCQFLYIMMIELMSNTHKHAYNIEKNKNIILPKWYCFAEYDGIDTMTFIFMDTGEGIPSTVRRKFIEKLDVLNFIPDNKYVISALNGEFRTSTNLDYRGKGLPKIREFCRNGKIHNLRIITNSADVEVKHNDYIGNENKCRLIGTLYRWTVSIQELKEDFG